MTNYRYPTRYDEEPDNYDGRSPAQSLVSKFSGFGYLKVKKFSAGTTGVAVAVASIVFSILGFGAKNTAMSWIALALSLAVFTVQMVFQTKYEHLNPTILVLALLSYVYSIGTNFLGLYIMQAEQFYGWKAFLDGGDAWFKLIAAAFIDIYPEAMLTWAISQRSGEDLVTNIGKAISR